MAQQKREGLDCELRDCEKDLARVMQLENEFNYLQMSLSDKNKQAQEMNQRLRFESQSEAKTSMNDKEQELLKMRENYESTLAKLREKQQAVDLMIKKQREEAQQTQLELTRLHNQM